VTASTAAQALGAARGPARAPRSASLLALAGSAALLASSCCVLPLVLVLVGVSGAWIGQLTRLAPYSPFLDATAIAALAVAAWRIYYRPVHRSDDAGAASGSCAGAATAACIGVGRAARIGFWIVAALTLMPIVVALLAPLFY
jgi:mercuric ion transport protein